MLYLVPCVPCTNMFRVREVKCKILASMTLPSSSQTCHACLRVRLVSASCLPPAPARSPFEQANISYNSAQSFGGSGSTSSRGRAGLHAAGAGAGAATTSSSAVTPFPPASAPASSSSLANGGPMHRAAAAAAGNSFATHTSRTLPPPLSMTPGVSAGSSPRQAPAGWRSGPPGGTSNDARVQQNSWLSNDGANGGGGGGISPRGFGQQPVARGSHHQLQVGSAAAEVSEA